MLGLESSSSIPDTCTRSKANLGYLGLPDTQVYLFQLYLGLPDTQVCLFQLCLGLPDAQVIAKSKYLGLPDAQVQ